MNKPATTARQLGASLDRQDRRELQYLYLIYPMREGDHRRVYIGANAERVAEARAGIERGREFDQLAKKRREVESCMNNASSALRDAVRSLQW